MPRCQNAAEDGEACRGCAADALRDFRGESRPTKQRNCTRVLQTFYSYYVLRLNFMVDGLIGAMLSFDKSQITPILYVICGRSVR